MAIHIKKSHEGLLHKDLGVAAGKHIPAGKLEKAEHSTDTAVKKRAVFAENAKHWHHGGHESHGFGHASHERHGHHRLSGHSGAHRIGHK